MDIVFFVRLHELVGMDFNRRVRNACIVKLATRNQKVLKDTHGKFVKLYIVLEDRLGLD